METRTLDVVVTLRKERRPGNVLILLRLHSEPERLLIPGFHSLAGLRDQVVQYRVIDTREVLCTRAVEIVKVRVIGCRTGPRRKPSLVSEGVPTGVERCGLKGVDRD